MKRVVLMTQQAVQVKPQRWLYGLAGVLFLIAAVAAVDTENALLGAGLAALAAAHLVE